MPHYNSFCFLSVILNNWQKELSLLKKIIEFFCAIFALTNGFTQRKNALEIKNIFWGVGIGESSFIFKGGGVRSTFWKRRFFL